MMVKFLDLQKITAKYANEVHEAVSPVGIYKERRINVLKRTILNMWVLNIP